MNQLGELKETIELLLPDPSTGPTVSFDNNYTVYTRARAKVEYPKGQSYWSAKAVSAETTVVFTVRFRRDLTPDMKIRYGGNVYEITAILPEISRKRYMTLHGKEVMDVGQS